MALTLRPGRPEDATICGTICYDAFTTIAAQHNFPSSYPSPEVSVARMVERLTHPGFYAVVAELDGRVVGSNFLDERCAIAGLGPITVAPNVQNRAIGRHLMQHALERVAARRCPGVRLVHASYHTRALSLYAKLGFTVRDFLARVTGVPPALQIPGYTVRPATLNDLDACDQVCRRVHGHDRSGELRDAVQKGSATVVEHAGHVSGYATVIGVSGHAVGEGRPLSWAPSAHAVAGGRLRPYKRSLEPPPRSSAAVSSCRCAMVSCFTGASAPVSAPPSRKRS